MSMEPQPTVREEGAVESIKIEKNSKGVNFSVRVVRKPGQTWADVLAELRHVEGELAREYGRG